jgi:hypothetical protein
MILGKQIGMAVGWEDVGTAAFIFLDFEPNELGLRFLRYREKWEDGTDLEVNFETGCVALSKLTHPEINPDWSVFNV